MLPDDLYMGLRIQVQDKQGTVAGRPTTTGWPALFFFLAPSPSLLQLARGLGFLARGFVGLAYQGP
jgi:hypothetical protein